MSEPIQRVQGEVVGPDMFDRLMAALEQRYGPMDRDRMSQLLRQQWSPASEADVVRTLLAALGGAVGAQYRWLGAAVGAGLATLIWDSLRERQHSRKPRLRLLRGDEDADRDY